MVLEAHNQGRKESLGMGIRKPILTNKRVMEEDDERLERKGSNSQSQVSFKLDKEKRHSRVIKKVHRPMPVKASRNEIISLDPRMSCISLLKLPDSFHEDNAPTQEAGNGSRNSFVFSLNDGGEGRDRQDTFAPAACQYLDYDPINEELIMGKTPIPETLNVDSGMPALDL